MKLDAHQLNHLRDIFETKPDGLSMEEFISVMSRALPDDSTNNIASSGDNRDRLDKQTVHSLRELFLQVDVNGDGTMEWDEFTGFCIDQGIAATVSHGSSAIPDQIYVESTKYVDKSRAFDSLVERIDWIPELDKIFVSESNCSSLKVYDPNRGKKGPLLLHQIKLEHSKSENLHDTKGAHKDRVKLAPARGAESKTVIHPKCVTYIAELGMIVVAMSDIALSFWDTGVYRRDPDGGIPWFVKRVHTEKLVLQMSWCGPTNTLFTCGGLTTGHILAWKVVIEGQMNQLTCRKVATLKGHGDVVTDLLSVVQMRGQHVEFAALVSSSLDKKIIVWDVETYAMRGKRTGHKMGVRSLAAVTGKNDGNLVLSAGFDAEVLLWEVGGLADKPLMRLKGHTAAVVQARMHSDGRIITIDNLCTVKWWHLGSDLSDSNSAQCIQTVLPFTGMGTHVPVPTTMVVAGDNKRILVGTKSMRVFDLVRVRPKSQPAVGILYNRSSMTVCAAQARNVRVWNATTGAQESNFHDCCDHTISHDADISALVLDRRHRKFLTADLAGSVSVFNFMNGALMKRASLLHTKEISAMVYCEADQCVITGSWDRSWKVLDEDAGNTLPVLRTIHGAHDFDISSVAHSHVLNLVATGDSNGVVKIWDFQFGTYEGSCCEINESGKGAEITSLTFLDPYPILVVTDCSGALFLYTVRPWYAAYRLVRKISNVITDKFGQSTTWPITTMKYRYDSHGGTEIAEGITSGRCLLFAGDENGNIGVYDCMPVILASGITTIRDKDIPTLRNNYNPRRRATMYGEGFPSMEAWLSATGGGEGDVAETKQRSRVSSKADSDLSEISITSFGSAMSNTTTNSIGTEKSTDSLPPLKMLRSSKTLKTKSSHNRKTSVGTLRKSASALSMGLGSAGGASMIASRKQRGSRRQTIGPTTSTVKRKNNRRESVGPLLDPLLAPTPTLLAQWSAHEGKAVTSIDVNIDDGDTNAIPFILSTGEDLVVRAFGLDGTPLGFLTKGDEIDKARRKPYPWACLVDTQAQAEEEHRLTQETRVAVLDREKGEEKAQRKAEANRQRAEAQQAMARSRPASPKNGTDAGAGVNAAMGDDVEWLASKGNGWEGCDGRLASALEISYQDDREGKRIERAIAEKEVAEKAAAEAKEVEKNGGKKKKKKKKEKEVWSDSDDEKNQGEEGVVEPGVVINVRGNKFLFDPDAMTLKSLDSKNSTKQRVKRKDGSTALAEKKLQQARLNKDRRRVVGQLMGETTWVLTDLERGRMMAEQAEQEKKRQVKLAAQKKRSAQEKKDAEMQELLSDPPDLKSPDGKGGGKSGKGDLDADAVKLPMDHPGNWAMGSKNRLKMLYPSYHSEQHRTQVVEEKRHQQHSPTMSPTSSGGEEDDGDENAAWLRSRLHVHDGLVQQLDLKRLRQTTQAKEAVERLDMLLQNQQEKAIEKRKVHNERLKNDSVYKAKYEASKKPAVPGHKVRKLTISQSAPKLTKELAIEAKRISNKLQASGVMPEKITSPEKIRDRLKYVMRDLETDMKSALRPSKGKNKRGKDRQGGTGKNSQNRSFEDNDGMTLEEKEDLDRMEAEEKALKDKKRAERRAALRNKLHFGTYTKEHIIHMRHRFQDMDMDGSGAIDLEEFLEQQETSHMSDHMASMFHAMDKDGDGHVTLREMCSVVFYKAPPREMNDIVAFLSMKKTPRLEEEVVNPITKEEVDELRQIFDLYDEDGGGFLDRMEIYKALGVISGYSAQTGLSLEELDAMIDEADVDGGGTIDKEEFVQMMSHVTHGVATFDPW